MYIKKVVLENFASYEKLQMDQDLSRGVNLILGKNGSGKSNFLQGKSKPTNFEFSHHLRHVRCLESQDEVGEA